MPPVVEWRWPSAVVLSLLGEFPLLEEDPGRTGPRLAWEQGGPAARAGEREQGRGSLDLAGRLQESEGEVVKWDRTETFGSGVVPGFADRTQNSQSDFCIAWDLFKVLKYEYCCKGSRRCG